MFPKKLKEILFSLQMLLIFSISNAQSFNWAWAKGVGGVDNETSYSSATDSQGNLYVVGTFSSSSINVGSYTLTNNVYPNYSLFIIKYDANNNVLFAKNSSGGEIYYNNRPEIVCDKNDNFYISASYQSASISLDNLTLTNNSSISSDVQFFILKSNSSGNYLWAKSYGNNGSALVSDIAVNSSNKIAVTGYFRSPTLDFDSYTLNIANQGSASIFVANLDENGNALWAKSAGALYSSFGKACDIDSSGNVYIAGVFYYSSLNIGGINLTNSSLSGSTQEIFVAKYNSAGAVEWAKSGGSSNDEELFGLEVDNLGNIYICGTAVNATFDNLSVNPSNTGDIFLLKYNNQGTPTKVVAHKISTVSKIFDIAIDNFNAVYITGYYYFPDAIFGTDTLHNSSPFGLECFIAKYDANSNYLWSLDLGTTEKEAGHSLSIAPNGNLFLIGEFDNDTLSFGNNITLSAAGELDMFVARLDAPLEVEEILSNPKQITAVPNPFSNFTKLIFNSEQKNASIQILDLLGNVVKSFQFSGNQLTIEKENLKQGVYFVHVFNENMTRATVKIVLQ